MMDPILEQFLEEARENLAYLDQHLEDLKDGDEESINALFRAAHTLKGGAGLVGFHAVKEITHAAEDLLDAYRKGELAFSDTLLETLYDAFDEVVEMIDAAEELGSVDIAVDDEKVEAIRNEIRAFFQKGQEAEADKGVETPFALMPELAVAPFLDYAQLGRLALQAPLDPPTIDQTFLANDASLWLVDCDLEEDTLTLGNDPVYLFDLLGEGALKEVAVILYDCAAIQEDPMLWKSRIIAAFSASAETIEDVFYNVLDDLAFAPLSLQTLLQNGYEPIEEASLLESFKNEAQQMAQSGDWALLDEKLGALLQIINPKTKEGHALYLLHAVAALHPAGEKLDAIAHRVLAYLGWEVGASEVSQAAPSASLEVQVAAQRQEERPPIDEKSRQSALTILQSQLKVLSLSKDANVLERTKLLLKNLLSFLHQEAQIDAIDSIDTLKAFVQTQIEALTAQSETSASSATTPKEHTVHTNAPSQQGGHPSANAAPKEGEQKGGAHKASQPPRSPKMAKEGGAAHISKTVKIDQQQIDELMDIVGELLVLKNSLPYIAKQLGVVSSDHVQRELLGRYEQISRVTDRLQDRVMGMRLLPLSYIFGRYPKLVRDISKKLGKKIEYLEEGGETKLDKTVIEKLADPMVHVIRNSLDHGIETPEERQAAGKPPVGHLKISARSEGDRVFITIEDDGRGIDIDKVVAKALEMRLVDPDKLDTMSREEKLKLIFEPGLSTKEKVTELSGRGVGTDAVKKVIEELGGRISIQSQIGVGTTTVFELPLSVALTNVFHVKMQEVNYAIAMDYVVETEKCTPDEIQKAAHQPFIRMRGELVPMLFEPTLLGRDEPVTQEVQMVVLRIGERKIALVVDGLEGQLDVVQKPLTGVLANHPYLSGISLLGNGEALFVLDPKKLIQATKG